MKERTEERATSSQNARLSQRKAAALAHLADELSTAIEDNERSQSINMQFIVDGNDLGVQAIPAHVVSLISEVLRDVAADRDVTVAPADLLLGTESISRTLGVSRTWVNKLIARGDIRLSGRCGNQRRVRLGDVVSYRRGDDEKHKE